MFALSAYAAQHPALRLRPPALPVVKEGDFNVSWKTKAIPGGLPAGAAGEARRPPPAVGEPGGADRARVLSWPGRGAGAHLGSGAFVGCIPARASHVGLAGLQAFFKIGCRSFYAQLLLARSPLAVCHSPAGRRRTKLIASPPGQPVSWQLDARIGAKSGGSGGCQARLIRAASSSAVKLLSFSNWLGSQNGAARPASMDFEGVRYIHGPRQVRRLEASTSRTCRCGRRGQRAHAAAVQARPSERWTTAIRASSTVAC